MSQAPIVLERVPIADVVATPANTVGLVGGDDGKIYTVTPAGQKVPLGENSVGSTPNLPIITGPSGVLIASSFGTTENTFCQGNDSRLSNSREWTADTIAQAEAEAGTATTRRAWTAQRVRQAIAAWGVASPAITTPTVTGLAQMQTIDLFTSTINNTRIRLNNTFVSEDNRETGYIRWVGSGFRIGTEKGSSGGTARSLFFETDGIARGNINNVGDWSLSDFTDLRIRMGRAAIRAITAGNMFLSHIDQDAIATYALRQTSSGQTTVNSATGQSLLLAIANTSILTINATNMFSTASFVWRPASSVTLGTNGDFAVELTSNTAGNLVYRGSDGVTRRMALTFS